MRVVQWLVQGGVLLRNQPESDVEMEKLLWERFQKEARNYVALNSKADTMASKNEKEMYIDPAMVMMSGDMLQPAVTQEDDIQMGNWCYFVSNRILTV